MEYSDWLRILKNKLSDLEVVITESQLEELAMTIEREYDQAVEEEIWRHCP